MRVVSGIQPTGDIHLGNYFGAIRSFLELQKEHDCFFFVADYHALTTVRDAARLRRMRFDCVCSYLALGLDPERAAIFLQSDVPMVTELASVLSNVTPVGLLQRSHAYKDKVARGLPADHGLFAYPVLMAADILLYSAEVVPVGEDQKQHLEITRDIAQRFNKLYGEVFNLPEPRVLPLVPGTDGRKMSKSHGNAIGVFDSEQLVREKVMRIRTDSKAANEPKDPEACPLFNLFRLTLDADECKEMAEQYRHGRIGYREVKLRLAERIAFLFAHAKQSREELRRQPEYIRRVLDAGCEKAERVARKTMSHVRAAVGLRVSALNEKTL